MKSTQLQKAFLNASTPKILGLAVSLTEQCNFRCTYFYEKLEIQSMNSELFDGLKRMIALRIPSLRHFSLNWFGGEPLLEWKRMAELGQYCRTLCHQHNVFMPPSTGQTTHGG